MAEATSPPKKKKRSTPHSEEEEDEGFKFTRQSRRTKVYYQGTNKSASKSAKKKRRSSFVRGRKERKSLAPPACTSKNNLHQNIPIGLPPNARLRMLFNASLELAITKIAEQPSNNDYPDFQEEAKAVFDHLRHVISDTDIIDEACQEQLLVEDGKWDELLHSYQQSEEKTKQELQEYTEANKSKEECPDFLSSSQHKLLSGKPALKSVFDKLEHAKQTSELQVDRICQTVSSLKQFKDVTESYLQEQMKSFGAKSLQVINDMGTPRTMIRGHLTGH